jgi:Tfp pilus assembly protein PilN
MINLLPSDIKDNYRYARRNSRLVRWIFAFSFALVGLAGLSVGGILYLDQTAKSYDSQVTALEDALKRQNQTATEKQVKEISNDLKLAVQVLSKEILFSQLLKQMATIIPNGAALSNLNISQVNGALDITADTADYNAATQLQVNLADPNNKIFSKADIVNINCAPAAEGAEAKRYPCTVTVRALFAPNNPFLFISNSKAAKP